MTAEGGARRAWRHGAAVALLAGGAALALRLVGLLRRPMWDDEGWTSRLVLAGAGTPWDAIRASVADFWPPLHYLLLNLLGHVAAPSLDLWRLTSAVAGSLAAAALAALTYRLTGRLAVGVLAGLLLAVNPAHLLFSQESRVYPLLSLLTIGSLWGLAAWFGDWRERWLYVPSTLLLLYAHNFGVFVFGPQLALVGGCLVLRGRADPALRQRVQRLAVRQVLVLALWAPLLLGFVLARQRAAVPTQWATGAASLGPRAWAELLQGLLLRSWGAAGVWAVLLIGGSVELVRRAIVATGTPVLGRRLPLVLVATGAGGVLLSSAALTWLTSVRSFGAIKYHVVAIPAFCLLAALAIERLPRAVAWAAAMGVPLVLGALDLPDYLTHFSRSPYDRAAARIRAVDSTAPILVGNGYRVLNHYLRPAAPRIGSPEWDRWSAAFAAEEGTTRSADGSPARASTYWSEKQLPHIRYVVPFGATSDSLPAMRALLRRSASESPGRYWLVGTTDGLEGAAMAELRASPDVCASPADTVLGDLRVVHCAVPGGAVVEGTSGTR